MQAFPDTYYSASASPINSTFVPDGLGGGLIQPLAFGYYLVEVLVTVTESVPETGGPAVIGNVSAVETSPELPSGFGLTLENQDSLQYQGISFDVPATAGSYRTSKVLHVDEMHALQLSRGFYGTSLTDGEFGVEVRVYVRKLDVREPVIRYNTSTSVD